jgi:hypothetical protein
MALSVPFTTPVMITIAVLVFTMMFAVVVVVVISPVITMAITAFPAIDIEEVAPGKSPISSQRRMPVPPAK